MIKQAIPHHLIVASSAWVSRIVMAVVQFASIRVLISYLGIEQYAVFALLAALMGWFMLIDMGLGASLQNHISGQRAKEQAYENYVVVTLVIAATFFILIITALYYLSPYLAQIYLKAFPQIEVAEKAQLLFVSGALFIGAAFGGISYKIWYAEQKGYLANIMPAIASLLGYSGIVAVNDSALPDKLLISIIIFYTPTALIPIGVITIQMAKNFREGVRKVNFKIAENVFKRAINFWLLTLMTSVALQIDYLVISQFLKPEDIVVYNLSTRISWLVLFIYVAALTALWPVFSEAIELGKWEVVKGLTQKYLKIGLSFTLVSSILMVWFMPEAIKILAPQNTIVVPTLFILSLGLYLLLRVWTDTFSMILQSMSDLKPLWIAGSLQAFLSVTLQWYLAQWIGLYGIILGNAMSFATTTAWLLPYAVNRHYKKTLVLK